MPSSPTPVLPKQIPHGPHSLATATHVSAQLIKASSEEYEAVLQNLRTSKSGLTDDEAIRRLREAGPNIVAGDERHPRLRLLRSALLNPLVILLLALASFSFLKKHYLCA